MLDYFFVKSQVLLGPVDCRFSKRISVYLENTVQFKTLPPVDCRFSNRVSVYLKNKHFAKSVEIRRFSGPYFPVFGLNKEIYE